MVQLIGCQTSINMTGCRYQSFS